MHKQLIKISLTILIVSAISFFSNSIVFANDSDSLSEFKTKEQPPQTTLFDKQDDTKSITEETKRYWKKEYMKYVILIGVVFISLIIGYSLILNKTKE